MGLSVTAGGSIPPEPVFDVSSAGPLMEASQVELADQIGYALVSQAKLMAQLAERMRAQTVLAETLRSLSAQSPSSHKVTLGGSVANELLTALVGSGVPVSDLSPKFLWVTRVEQFDKDGNSTGSSVTGDWRSQRLSSSSQVSDGQIPQSVWDSARAASPDAQLLDADGGEPPPAVLSGNTVTNQDGSKETTTTWCFEASPNIIAEKSDVDSWSGLLDQAANAAATQLESMIQSMRCGKQAYEQVVANTAELKSMVDKQDAEKVAARSTTQRNDDLRLQRVRQEVVRQQAQQPDVLHADLIDSEHIQSPTR